MYTGDEIIVIRMLLDADEAHLATTAPRLTGFTWSPIWPSSTSSVGVATSASSSEYAGNLPLTTCRPRTTTRSVCGRESSSSYLRASKTMMFACPVRNDIAGILRRMQPRCQRYRGGLPPTDSRPSAAACGSPSADAGVAPTIGAQHPASGAVSRCASLTAQPKTSSRS